MRVSVRSILAGAFLTVALRVSTAAGVAQSTPAPSAWENPFCDGEVYAHPIDPATRAESTSLVTRQYVVDVTVNGTRDASAEVVLVSDTGAYRAALPLTRVKQDSKDEDAYIQRLVVFDQPTEVRYAFVDRITIDDKPAITCPSFIQKIYTFKPEPGHTPPPLGSDDPTVTAAFVMALPPPGCKTAYEPARTTQTYPPPVGNFGYRKATVLVHVYLDSAGRVTKSLVWQSSGVDGIDAAGQAASRMASYAPAKFLCVPVVSDYLFRMDYNP